MRAPLSETAWATAWGPPVATDGAGRFQFAGLNANADGSYVADLKFHSDYLPLRAPLRFGETNVIRLEAGRVAWFEHSNEVWNFGFGQTH